LRTLILCTLAATLAGCSSQPLTQRSCNGLNPLACLTAVDVPIAPSSNDDSSAVTTTSAIAQREEATRRPPRPKMAAKAAPAVSQPPPARTGAADRPSTGETTLAKAAEQRVESASADDMPASSPDASLDTLVAILVTGPDVRSLKELAGKTVAIDDRYSEPSIGRVRVAMAAAGATDIQLSKGQSTAISRLAGKEVSAAVIGLVSVGAADSFPELARLKTFRVPLSPRVAKK
jgi:hypothetical protein